MIVIAEMEFEWDEDVGPVALEIEADFTPGRPAPAVSVGNYDATLCDPGDPAEFDIKAVRFKGTKGHVAPMYWKDNDAFDEAAGEALIEEWESTR